MTTDTRACLEEDTLDHLVRITGDGPSLTDSMKGFVCSPPIKKPPELVVKRNRQLEVYNGQTFSLDSWEEWISPSEI